jgi:hypothetical protein
VAAGMERRWSGKAGGGRNGVEATTSGAKLGRIEAKSDQDPQQIHSRFSYGKGEVGERPAHRNYSLQPSEKKSPRRSRLRPPATGAQQNEVPYLRPHMQCAITTSNSSLPPAELPDSPAVASSK